MKYLFPLILLLPRLAFARPIDITEAPYNAVSSTNLVKGYAYAGSATLHLLYPASDFQNGQKIFIKGVGPLNALSAPCPAVTVIGATGSHTLAYEVALIDTNLGLSAVGCPAKVTNALNTQMEGNYHNSTELQWTAPAGANYSCIYKKIEGAGWIGTYAVAGAGRKTFFDFNQDQLLGVAKTLMNPLCPATPPPTATNGDLLTTIVSGGGTTTPMVATVPTKSSGSVVPIYHDNTAAIQMAFAAAGARQIYVPAGTYRVHSAIYTPWHGFSLYGDGTGSIIQGTPGSDILAVTLGSGPQGPITIKQISLNGGNSQFHVYGTNCIPGAMFWNSATCMGMRGVTIADSALTGANSGVMLEDGSVADTIVIERSAVTHHTSAAIEVMPSIGQGIGLTLRNDLLGGLDGQNYVCYFPGNIYEDNVGTIGAGEFQFYSWGSCTALGSTFINPQGENNGTAFGTGKVDNTRGTISSGSNSLVVASATHLLINNQINVKGAGAAGVDLGTLSLPVYICAISGTTLTLTTDTHTADPGCANAAKAGASVVGTATTNALYSGYVFTGGPSNGLITFIGGSIFSYGNARYSIDLEGGGYVNIMGMEANEDVNDPTKGVYVLGAPLSVAVRRPH